MTRDYVKFQGIKFYWHPFSKFYLASRCGKILSLKRKEKRILKFHIRGKGYLGFRLFENNVHKDYSIHRFVYEAFKGEIPSDKQVGHIDSCKENNSISNLQLLSPKENLQKSNCKKVISLNIETKEEKIFDSLSQAAEFYQIAINTVCENCQKKIKISKSKKDGKKFQFFYL